MLALEGDFFIEGSGRHIAVDFDPKLYDLNTPSSLAYDLVDCLRCIAGCGICEERLDIEG